MKLVFGFVLFLLLNARPTSPFNLRRTDNYDDASYSNMNQIQTDHMDIFLKLDFEATQISGFNILSMTSMVDYLYSIILDTQGMEILRVTNIQDEDLSFKVTKENPNIGDALRIFLNDPLMKGRQIDVIVYYKTTAD